MGCMRDKERAGVGSQVHMHGVSRPFETRGEEMHKWQMKKQLSEATRNNTNKWIAMTFCRLMGGGSKQAFVNGYHPAQQEVHRNPCGGGRGPFSLRIGTFLPQYVLLMYRVCIIDVLCWDTFRSMSLGVSRCIILYPLRNTCILRRYICIVCIGNVS